MTNINQKTGNSPGFPEAVVLTMLVLAVVPAWLSEGTGRLFIYTVAVTVLTYVGFKVAALKTRH